MAQCCLKKEVTSKRGPSYRYDYQRYAGQGTQEVTSTAFVSNLKSLIADEIKTDQARDAFLRKLKRQEAERQAQKEKEKEEVQKTLEIQQERIRELERKSMEAEDRNRRDITSQPEEKSKEEGGKRKRKRKRGASIFWAWFMGFFYKRSTQ